MKAVIFPEPATSDQSNPLQSLPKAGTGICLRAVFPSFWVRLLGWEALMCPSKGLFTASSNASSAGTDLTLHTAQSRSPPELQGSERQLSSLGAHPKDTRPSEVTHCICWKADMVSLGKYL